MKVGILIALAVMFLLMALLFLPLGIRLHFTDSGTLTQLKIGPFRKTVDTNAPRKPKKKKTKKSKKNGKQKKSKKSKKKKTKLRFRPEDFESLLTDLLPGVKRSFRHLGRSFIFDPLELTVIIAKGDPCETARTYGYASALLYTLMPWLEDVCTVRHPHILLDMDIDGTETVYRGEVGIALRLGSLMAFMPMLLRPGLRWYRAIERVPIAEEINKITTSTTDDEKGGNHGQSDGK